MVSDKCKVYNQFAHNILTLYRDWSRIAVNVWQTTNITNIETITGELRWQ